MVVVSLAVGVSVIEIKAPTTYAVWHLCALVAGSYEHEAS